MSRKWKRWYWLTLLPLHRHSLPRKRVSKFVCLKGRIAPPRTRCVWSSVICTAISEIKLRVLTKVRYRSAPRCRKRRRQVTETRHGTRNTATDQRLRQKCWENVQKNECKEKRYTKTKWRSATSAKNWATNDSNGPRGVGKKWSNDDTSGAMKAETELHDGINERQHR